jgi:hypothetical protein
MDCKATVKLDAF